LSWLKNAREWCKDFESEYLKVTHPPTFSEFAFQKFSTFSWHKGFNLFEVVKEFISYPEDLYQPVPHSNFGDPPMTLFFSQEGQFYLDLYIWRKSHTTIHEHGFEGCFTVLEGSSLESKYTFTPDIKGNNHSLWGRLEKKEMRYITQGETRPILPTGQFIHRVLHLENPTVSLVLRTYGPTSGSQQSYSFNCLSSPSFAPGSVIARGRALEWMLLSGQTSSFEEIADILNYSETWDRIFSNPLTRQFALEMTAFFKRQSLTKNIQRSHAFNSLFQTLDNKEGKILLAALEHYGVEEGQEWVRKILNRPDALLKPMLQEHLHSPEQLLQLKFFFQ
jgi:hypothetical protein